VSDRPDVVVVGAGPNGLVAAVTLARAGLDVLVLEAAATPGGGTRSEELTLTGFVHDVCSAVHPLALASPALRDLPLAEHGLAWVQPPAPVAHVLDGASAFGERSLAATAEGLGEGGGRYRRLLAPLVEAEPHLSDALLAPLAPPPLRSVPSLARFGALGLLPAAVLQRVLPGDAAPALVAGLAAHSMLPLGAASTAGYGLLLGVLAHTVGWPVAVGGSQRIADALVALLVACGGRLECDRRVESLDELPAGATVVLDVTPAQLLAMASERLPEGYRRRLRRYRYGPGVHKVDWALDGPIPWADPAVARAGTVHVGGAFAEVAAAEAAVHDGRHPERPFVLLSQPTLFDPSRAPAGRHTAWAYCHVPNGSTVDMTERIERQVERFAPGFRDRILARHVMGPAALQAHDANYVGGDINGGLADLRQFVARPVAGLHPWRTPVDGLFMCSSSTPPGGGVHGMCGWHAAREVLVALGASSGSGTTGGAGGLSPPNAVPTRPRRGSSD